ncbi:hypothetical protein PWT90_10911 [Aphanocladium album]|nr:hypothetical protein PWT90_10911 [Aphanocladium album]
MNYLSELGTGSLENHSSNGPSYSVNLGHGEWGFDQPLHIPGLVQAWDLGVGQLPPPEPQFMPCTYEDTIMVSPEPSSSMTARTASPETNITTPETSSTPMVRRGSRRSSKERNHEALLQSVANAKRQVIFTDPSAKPLSVQKRKEKQKVMSGDHEYSRHMRLAHEGRSWRWQVIDPCEKNLWPIFAMKTPISDCKRCSSGKLYGHNYNAAAHLRRCHFPELGKEGSRAGRSGGKHPHIRYLEYAYMKLVEVRRDLPAATSDPLNALERTGLESRTQFRIKGAKANSPPLDPISEACAFYNCHKELLSPFLQEYLSSAEKCAKPGSSAAAARDVASSIGDGQPQLLFSFNTPIFTTHEDTEHVHYEYA